MKTKQIGRALVVFVALVVGWAGWCWAANPYDPAIASRAALVVKNHPGLAEYFAAAQALEAGHVDECRAGLDKAVAADGNRPLYHLARGAVLVLAGRSGDAAADLAAAGGTDGKVSDPGGYLIVGPSAQPEAMMWSAAIDRLAGKVQKFGPYHRIGFTFTLKNFYESQATEWIAAGGPAEGKEHAALMHHLAERLLSVPDVLPLRLKQADDLIAAGESEKALPILRQLSVVMADDLAWLAMDADAHLAAGYSGTARIQYDKLLLQNADDVEAYLGHALASAHIGAIQREKDDLAVAASLDPSSTTQFHQQHDAELQALENSMPKEDAKTLTQQFIDAAKGGEDDEKLVARALRLRHAVNAIRHVPQEKYIDGMRRRLNAMKANPKDAAAFADIATFIYQEAPNEFGQGKGDGIQWESDRIDAMWYANQALRLDPNNIQAISTKGWLLEQDDQEKDALTLAQNGLQLIPGYPRLANLQNTLLEVSSLRAQQQAGNLRSTKSGMIFTPDAIITWTRPPSQAELDAAKQYDAMSSANIATANQSILAGWRQFSDSVEQMDVIADYLDYHGQQQQAIDLYKKVLAIDPDNETALMQLADVHKDNHQVDEAFELQFRLDNVFATSAAAMIDKAASDEQAQNLVAVKSDLDRALAVDPTDARVYVELAHLNVNTDAAEWDAFVRCGIAMCEAQMRINHETFALGAQGSIAPADAPSMIMLLQNRAQYLQQNNRAADADKVNQQVADIQRRVTLSKAYLGAQDSPAAFQNARLQWEKQLIANNEMPAAARFCLEIPNRVGSWHSESSNDAYQIEYPVYRYLVSRVYHFQLWHFFGPGTLENYEAWASSHPNTDTGVPPANNRQNAAE